MRGAPFFSIPSIPYIPVRSRAEHWHPQETLQGGRPLLAVGRALVSPSASEQAQRRGARAGGEGEPVAMKSGPQLEAAGSRLLIELPAGAERARHRFEQVVLAVRLDRLVRLLALVAGAGEIAVGDTCEQAVAQERL